MIKKFLQLINNLSYTTGSQIFTFGEFFEKFQFDNSFNLGNYDEFDAPPCYGTFTILGYGRLSVDILNVGNMFNSDWRLVQVPTSVQPINVKVNGNTPIYTFNGTQKKTFKTMLIWLQDVKPILV